jgi:lipid II:glycine glycyltransferase (peptidoglycan interpeptide bridge formation enzyme)
LYEVIKNACEKGYTWFDFNPSGGLEGVKAFKERFGAQALKCPIVRLEPRNMRTVAIGKVYDKVIVIKKRTKCALPTPLFKNISND